MSEPWEVRAEMEWPDAHTVVLPPGWKWSPTCFCVVNSDGIANDPQRRLVRYGGQVNTPAARSIDDLATMTDPLFVRLAPRPNYRAAMRVAVRVPSLRDDLPLLKRICDFTHRNLPRLWPQIDPLDPLLDLGEQASELERRGAAARLTLTIRARHYFVPLRVHAQRMAAPSMAAFTAPPAVAASNGRMLPVPLREALDVRHSARADWVVLRCFASPADAGQLRAAAGFALGWVRAAAECTGNTAEGADPGWLAALAARWAPGLARQMPYHHGLEMGWRHTNFLHNARQVVAARLEQASSAGHGRPA